MSKIIYACLRTTPIDSAIKDRIYKICEELNPDNISARSTKLIEKNDIIFGINNPVESIKIEEENVLLGTIFGQNRKWKERSEEIPDGNFVIFRSWNEGVEILTDCIGSRSVWYYIDDEKFVASTSQKAIIRFIGDFQFDERVIPWIISTGMLGPQFCWDKRIKKIPSETRLTLKKQDWKLQINSKPVIFKPSDKTLQHQKKLLKDALIKTFQNIYLNPKKWLITLSGGHDSRAILILLRKFGNQFKDSCQTITWGEKASIYDKHSDAYIAQRLAKNQFTIHKYYSTEDAGESIDKVIERFLRNGDGQIDHISGYLDGFKIWKQLHEDGVEGVIRGNEVFGYNKIYSTLAINSFMGLTLCSDYSNLKKYKYINSLQQEKPHELFRKPQESLSTWRDRVFQTYRIPYAQAALADLKFSYVEQINPFLSKKIVSVTRQMRDHLRTNKKLFKAIMESMNPEIPFSKKDSNVSLRDTLRREDLVKLIKKELLSESAKTIFPISFLQHVVRNLRITDNSQEIQNKNLKTRLISFIPKYFKAYLAQQQNSLKMDENLLGFRIFIICRMYRILNESENSLNMP